MIEKIAQSEYKLDEELDETICKRRLDVGIRDCKVHKFLTIFLIGSSLLILYLISLFQIHSHSKNKNVYHIENFWSLLSLSPSNLLFKVYFPILIHINFPSLPIL